MSLHKAYTRSFTILRIPELSGTQAVNARLRVRQPRADRTEYTRLTRLALGHLILLALLLALALSRLGADLLVVLLESGEVLAGLRELALLHALADVPVDEGT